LTQQRILCMGEDWVKDNDSHSWCNSGAVHSARPWIGGTGDETLESRY
jgi:hypothetical protein